MKRINILSKSTCTRIIEICSHINFHKSLIIDDTYKISRSVHRKSNTAILNDQVIHKLLRKLQVACEQSIQEEWGIKLNQWTTPTINRYSEGEYYKTHTDSNKSYLNCRAFSCVTFLNDDFEGGELYFPLKNKSFVPKTGSSILFASDELHGSKIIKSGTKYSLVQFIVYPKFLV